MNFLINQKHIKAPKNFIHKNYFLFNIKLNKQYPKVTKVDQLDDRIIRFGDSTLDTSRFFNLISYAFDLQKVKNSHLPVELMKKIITHQILILLTQVN